MRKPLIAANWKMYKTPEQARSFLKSFLPLIDTATRNEVVICPPATDLVAALEETKKSAVRIGAQNMYFAEEGAYTGEISAGMLTALGVTHVILGHSERRQYFCETDETVNKKLVTALKHGLVPIVCVGEREQERDAGLTTEVLNRQTSLAIANIPAAALEPLVIAYEPVWAIGTGKTATCEMAAEAHRIIRSVVARIAGPEIAEKTRILYGGSVKPDNCEALLQQPEIDGALVGGASLDPQSFIKIVASV